MRKLVLFLVEEEEEEVEAVTENEFRFGCIGLTEFAIVGLSLELKWSVVIMGVLSGCGGCLL